MRIFLDKNSKGIITVRDYPSYLYLTLWTQDSQTGLSRYKIALADKKDSDDPYFLDFEYCKSMFDVYYNEKLERFLRL